MNAGFFYLTSFGLVLTVLLIIGAWKAFVKAGQEGWAVLIPIYNYFVALKIAERSWWWIFLLFIPIVNIITLLIVNIDIAKRFGKGAAFGVGLWLLPFIFFPILGFGESAYLPRNAAQAAEPPTA